MGLIKIAKQPRTRLFTRRSPSRGAPSKEPGTRLLARYAGSGVLIWPKYKKVGVLPI